MHPTEVRSGIVNMHKTHFRRDDGAKRRKKLSMKRPDMCISVAISEQKDSGRKKDVETVQYVEFY